MAPAAGFSEVLAQFVDRHASGDPAAAGRLHPGIATRPLFSFEPVAAHPRVSISARPPVAPRAARASAAPGALRLEPRRPVKRTLSPRQQQALSHLIALGAPVTADFTAEELRSAFRLLARQYHPDRHPGIGKAEQARLSAAFAAVRGHYDVLKTAA